MLRFQSKFKILLHSRGCEEFLHELLSIEPIALRNIEKDVVVLKKQSCLPGWAPPSRPKCRDGAR
jgi:hypothetical protein